jgi:hypothetical protein
LIRSLASLALAATVALAACTGTITDPDESCAGSPLPPPPEVTLGPGPVARVIVPAELALSVSALPAETGEFVRLEVEIWRADPDGSARDRAWVGVSEDPTRRDFALSDGTLENAAAFIGELEPWQHHLVRARHVAITAEGCGMEGAWSDKRYFRTDDGSATLFDPALTRDYQITLPQASIDSINAEAIPPGCVPHERSYYTGTLRFEDRDFTDVGVKVKGGCGSARNLGGKAGLKLHLSWDSPAVPGCPDTRRIVGQERFTFNNMVQDRSMSHEQLAYTLYRAMGVPVPRTNFARVLVNGTLYGIYLHVETIDRRFLARHFASNGGQLYEGTYRCDLVAGNARPDDGGCLRRTFEPDPCDGAPDPGDDPLDYAPLLQLIAELDAMPAGGVLATLQARFDVEALLSMWAVDAVLSHWDGHIYELVNNYRVYHDPGTDRWTILPSGVDQTFQNIDDDPWSVSARIGQRCLAEPACEAAFAARLRQAVEVYVALDLTARRLALKSRVEYLLLDGAGRDFSRSAFDSEHAETQAFIDQRAAQVMQHVSARGF